MSTLIKLFDQHRDQLAKSIGKDTNPDKVVNETRRFLDLLGIDYLEQIESDSTQRRLVSFVIDILKAGVSVLATATQTEIWQHDPTPVSVSRHGHPIGKRFWWRVGQIVGVFMLIAILWTSEEFFVSLLFFLLISSEIIRVLPHNILKLLRLERLLAQDSTSLSIEKKPLLQVKVQVDVHLFLTKFADMVLTVDKMLVETTAAKTPSHEEGGLENYPHVIKLLQDLLEARNDDDSAFALKKAKTIPAVLEHYNIHIEMFNGKNHQFFEFLPSLDPNDQSYKTIIPALMKDDRLISRGCVTEPESS